MTRTRDEWPRATLSLALVLSGVFGIVSIFSVNDLNGQGTGNPGTGQTKSKSAAARQPELATDLDNAIQILEQNDFRAFLEQYAPVDVLRRLRQQDLVERAAAMMSSKPQTKQQLLAILKALRKQTPTFDKSRGLATMQFDTLASGVEEIAGELHVPVTDDVKLVGLGADLNKVMEEATRLLEAGDVQAFVERLFPASELARLQEPGAMQDLVQQFKVTTGVPTAPRPTALRPGGLQPVGPQSVTPQPVGPRPGGLQAPLGPAIAQPVPQQNQDSPNFLQAFQADFKRLQTLTPELTDKGQVAVFRIESQNQQPARVIKFQKMGTDWRLFDDAGRVIGELTRQSKLKPRSAVTTVQMERIGGNWRFIELPALRLDGK